MSPLKKDFIESMISENAQYKDEVNAENNIKYEGRK